MANNKLNIIEGAVAGIALGVAASMFLTSKKGKELRKSIEYTTADFYKHISSKVKKISKMSEKEYKEFMKNASEKYVEAKKIPEDMAKQLIKNAQQSWKHFSKNLEN
jgi:gas vesicle protein